MVFLSFCTNQLNQQNQSNMILEGTIKEVMESDPLEIFLITSNGEYALTLQNDATIESEVEARSLNNMVPGKNIVVELSKVDTVRKSGIIARITFKN